MKHLVFSYGGRLAFSSLSVSGTCLFGVFFVVLLESQDINNENGIELRLRAPMPASITTAA